MTKTRLVTFAYFIWIALIVIALAAFTQKESPWNILPHAQPWRMIALLLMGSVACALVHYPLVWLERKARFEELKRRIHLFTA